MEYTCINEKGQVQFDLEDNLIQIPTGLHGFSNTKTGFYPQPSNGHDAYVFFTVFFLLEQIPYFIINVLNVINFSGYSSNCKSICQKQRHPNT